MWGKRKRKKRRGRLSRQLALELLEDAMGRVQQFGEDEDEAPRYPGAVPPPTAPPDPPGLRATDVPVDNSTGPEPPAAADDPDPGTPRQHGLPAERTGNNSHHGTFG